MSEFQQEEKRKQAQYQYCHYLFRKDSLVLQPGLWSAEVYQFDGAHSVEDSLDMRLEAMAGLMERDYPSVVPVRAYVEHLVCEGTEEEKRRFLMQEKSILRAHVRDFQTKRFRDSIATMISEENKKGAQEYAF